MVAEDKTITLDYNSFGLTTSYSEKNATVDGFSFTVNQGYKGSGNTIQMNSTKGSGILYNTTAITGLKSIKVNVYSGSKTYTITTGTSEKPTANSQTGSSTGTYNAATGDTYFQLKVSGASYFSSIVITYDDSGSGGGSELTASDLALTGAPVALSFDLYNNSSAQTVSYTTSSTGAVTVSGGEGYCTTSVSGNTITVTPSAVTPSAQTITVSQEADDTYAAGTATFTVTITDSTPVPTHTVTFSVNGTTSTQEFEEGASITFPENPADIEGKVFVGWTTEAISGITDTAPEFVTSATMGQNDVTFYAVFATTGGSGAALNKMQGGDTFAVGDQIVIVAVDGNASYALYQKTVNSSYVGYYEFDGQYSTVIADDKNWLTVSSSSTDNAWNLGDATNGYIYSSGSNNLSIDANNASSFTLDYVDNSGFTLKYGTRWLSFRNDVSTPNFRLGGTGATPLGIGYFDIYKIGSGSTYSAYCTTVVAETREEAGISFAEATVTKDITASYTGQALTNPHNVSPITWTSSNETVATVEDGAVTMVAPGETTITAAFAGNESYKPATVSYTLTVNDPTVATTLTINSDDITNTNVFTSNTAGSLSASVTTETGAPIDNASISWTSSNEQVATINQQGIVTLVAAGTTTITASYAGLQYTYGASTATYELNVVNTDPNAPGTEQNPYTVAQALANTPSNGNVYATGIVSKFVSGIAGVFSDNYHRYYISDDGTTQSGQLLVFNGKGLNNVDFTSNDDVQIGDIVTIYGDLVLYGSTKEFGAGNYIVSLKRAPVAPTFSPEGGTYTSVQSVEISCETKGSVIYYTTDGTEPTIESTPYTEAITVNADMTIKAIAVKDDLVSEVATAEYVIDFTPSIVFGDADKSYDTSYDAGNTNVYYTASNISGDLTLVLCDADGNATTYDWFRASITSDVYVHVEWDANTDTENARTAYFKLVAGNVESPIYTVTQPKFVADYATLPFVFDNGKNAISTTSGLTQEGLGSDYDSSPKLRFDGTGDYLILKISERPGILTFDIKGNSFSGGAFKVQTSEDGETYTDLKTYTSLSDTKSESFNNLGEDVRCIKWIYATKQNGNVALGNIAIAKYEEQTPEPSITIVPATVEATAAKTEGTLTVTYVDVDTDAEIVWYTDETATATTTSPSWILSEINSTTKNIDYTIQANNGGARTAYLKVYGLDAKGDDVYSNLVTISQEAPSAPAATTKWVLTDIDKLSDTDIVVIVGKTDDDYYAMSNDKGTGNAPEAVKVTVTDNTLSEPIGDNILWNISGNGTNGYTFYPNGESEKWLYCINSNNGVRVGDNTGKTFKIENDYLKHVATSRYVGIYNDQDWRCYTNTTGNIADQTLGFYRKVEPVKFAASGYASYCSSSALDLTPTEDYAAWIVTEVTGTMVKFTKIVGAVPAGTPVILYGQNFGGQTALLPVAKGEPTAIVGNMLRGTLVDTYVDTVEGDYTNFGLSNGKFVRMNSGTVKAHKAFLPILTADLPSNNARMSIVFSDETTGIALNEKMETRNENQIYNLNGQRVETLKKGSLYIVNGKKVVF